MYDPGTSAVDAYQDGMKTGIVAGAAMAAAGYVFAKTVKALWKERMESTAEQKKVD